MYCVNSDTRLSSPIIPSYSCTYSYFHSPLTLRTPLFSLNHPKCELPELKIRPITGLVLAAKSRPMLLGQYKRSNRSNVVSVLVPCIGISNLPSFRRSLAQQWHFTGPRVVITPENHVGGRKARLRPSSGSLLGQS